MEGKCYCCGKPGHRPSDCRQKEKIPKEEWVINKSQSHTAENSAAGGEEKPDMPSMVNSAASSITAITAKKL
jgi:hypothetical protein